MSFGKKYGACERHQERDGEYVKKRRAAFALWNLKRIRITYIVIKLVVFVWACIWSVTVILCFFSRGFKLLAPFVLVPAIGCWVLLAHLTNSVTDINQEMQQIKETMDE